MNNPLINNSKAVDNASNTQIKSKIKSTFDLLKRGESEIQLSDKYKDIVLILGNTGAGKTTFTQWIAGDNNKLIAKEVAKGTGQFIIEDDNRISNSTINSKTIFPELVINTKTNTTYYDCPGFSDTRSTSNDIATTYFIKKVLDHSKSVKIILIINHYSVQKGLDRQDFMKLIRHATDLVKDINKFQNSIAIVATKVDNQYVKQGKSFTLVEDSKVIGAIADFLQEVKQDLGERIKLPDISAKEHKFYDNAIKFIDVLLVKEGDHYTKIGIFRRPDEPGPLSNITLLQEGKDHVERILYEKLNFTEKVDEDFGYTISEKSKNDINDIVEEINNNIWSNVSNIAEKVKGYYHDLVEQVSDKIRSFVTSGAAIVDVEQSEAQIFSSQFNDGYNITLNLVEELTNLTNTEELTRKINNSITSLDINLFRDDILDVANQAKYFNFLQIVSDKALSTRPWAELFKNILPYFSELRANLEKDVNDTAQKLNKYLNDTVKTIHKHYDKKMKLLEIQELPAELRKEHDIMFNIVQEIENVVTTNELLKTMQTIHDSTNSLGISIARNNTPIIVNQEKYFNFLQIISNKELTTGTLTWISPFKDAVNYLNQSEQWYLFLNSLYSKFSEYEIQKDRDKYNVANLEDWGIKGKLQGIEINKNNFEQFVNKTAEYNIAEYDNIKNILATGLQLKELNHILDLTLKHKVNISCIEPYLFIKGNYIVVEKVLREVGLKFLQQHWEGTIPNNMAVNMDDSCDLTTSKYEKLKFINVFALNTIFINTDVELGANNPLAVIAPKWEIIGTRKISLDGPAGISHYNATIQKPKHFTLNIIHGRSKAEDGVYPGAHGKDGKPGGAGGPGGNFFGIGEQFINGTNLTITANGGTGGAGQDGGNGFKGRDGSSPTIESMSDISCRNDLCDDGKQINGFDCAKISCSTQPLEIHCQYNIFGTHGRNGGHGGHGGSGGKGGNPGSIVLFELNDNSEISKHLNIGKDGENGKGGMAGGHGSDSNQKIIVSCKSEWWFGKWYEQWNLQEISVTLINQRAPTIFEIDGMYGIDGAIAPTEDPKPATIINELNKVKIINQYKSYLRENLNDRFTKSFLTEFFNKLDSNQNVKNVYNTLGLVDELQSLEEQFHKLNKDIDLLPFYQSLLDRISTYAPSPKSHDNSNQYKKVLIYLYTATLGKIYHLEDHLESNLIVNITAYLNSVPEDIEKLTDLQNTKNKPDIINKYKQEYKDGIDIKIKEAQNIIEKEITPEIDNIGLELDKQIDALVTEITELKSKVEEETQDLINKKHELENALALRGVFSFFKIFGQVVSFFGPFGAVVGSIVEYGSTITESLVLDSKTNQRKTLTLPQSIIDLQKLKEHIKTIRDKKNRFNKLLKYISEEINTCPEKLGHVSAKVAHIQDMLNKVNEHKFNYKEVQVLENELKVILQTEEELIKTQQGTTDQKTKKAIAIIEKSTKLIQVGLNVGFDIYCKYQNDRAQLDTINDAIKQKKNELKALTQYEEKIADSIAPMLQNIENDLDEIASKLGTKSQVSLTVTKWQVQSTLKDIMLQMQQLTRGLKVQDNLVHVIQKLQDGMTTLINVYDHIQDYQKDQNLANYIADISSATVNNINITDQELRDAMLYLDITVKSNIVLQRYQVAIDAFKQFVFPFAHIYLKTAMLPSHLKLANDSHSMALENLVSAAVTQIGQIKSQLRKYKEALTTKYDVCLIEEAFSSHSVSSKPFFVWKNEQHKNMISKLLSGVEVVVQADIMHSSSNKDAIKFNVVEWHFLARNDTVQSIINNTLKKFDLSTTHLGNSYYRYNDKFYLIKTNKLDIYYSFEKQDNKEPQRKSNTYNKMKHGDFMLSPYASWKIKLHNATEERSFQHLEIYKDEIDLVLEGHGYYINKIKNSCVDLMVDNYYRPIHTYDQLDLDIESQTIDTSGTILNNRDMRSVNQVDEVYDYYVTNAAVPYMSSPINYVCNLLKDNILQLKNFNPVKQIKDWFNVDDAKEQSRIDWDFVDNLSYQDNNLCELNADYANGRKLLGLGYKVEQSSSRLIGDEESSIIHGINYNLLDKQGNLLLFDLLLRKQTGIKYNNKEAILVNNNDAYAKYAHSLAYSSYASVEEHQEEPELLGVA